jgi:hypothetical protein
MAIECFYGLFLLFSVLTLDFPLIISLIPPRTSSIANSDVVQRLRALVVTEGRIIRSLVGSLTVSHNREIL